MGYILILLFIILLFFHFDKTCCFLIAFYPLLSMIGITNSINLFQVTSIIAIIFFFLLKNKHIKQYPFYLSLFTVASSHIISNIMTIPHWPTSFSLVTSEYAFPIIFWFLMHNAQNRAIFYSYFTIFIYIICLYGIYEFITQSNPIYDLYVKSSVFIGYDAERSEDIRFGSMRCHSLMRDVGAMGTICCISYCLLFFQYKYNKIKSQIEKINITTLMPLCILCTFLTGTRTVILALCICISISIILLNARKKIVILIILSVIAIIFIDYFKNIYTSFYDTQSVTGSSTQMRKLQLAVVMNVFDNSPIYGLGLEGTSNIINKYTSAYGLESIWFQLIINYGILGAIAFAVSIIQGGYYSIKNKNIIALTIVAIFLLVKTMSSIPGIGNGYFIYIIIYLISKKRNITYENRNYYNA